MARHGPLTGGSFRPWLRRGFEGDVAPVRVHGPMASQARVPRQPGGVSHDEHPRQHRTPVQACLGPGCYAPTWACPPVNPRLRRRVPPAQHLSPVRWPVRLHELVGAGSGSVRWLRSLPQARRGGFPTHPGTSRWPPPPSTWPPSGGAACRRSRRSGSSKLPVDRRRPCVQGALTRTCISGRPRSDRVRVLRLRLSEAGRGLPVAAKVVHTSSGTARRLITRCERCAGSVELKILKLHHGSYFPEFPEPRRTANKPRCASSRCQRPSVSPQPGRHPSRGTISNPLLAAMTTEALLSARGTQVPIPLTVGERDQLGQLTGLQPAVLCVAPAR